MKYKLTDETREWLGHVLHRIECVESFYIVKAGDKGGWIEKVGNLSQYGNAWVCGDALVYDNAKVYGNALVYGNAEVCDNAWVCGDALVYDNAKVCGDALVYDNAEVCDNAKVCDNAEVCGNAWVYGDAWVCDNALVYGNAKVCGNAEVCGNADYMVFKNYWSSGRYFTWTRSNDKWKVGCFYGTGDELIKKAYADSETSGRHYEAFVRLVESLMELDKDK